MKVYLKLSMCASNDTLRYLETTSAVLMVLQCK